MTGFSAIFVMIAVFVAGWVVFALWLVATILRVVWKGFSRLAGWPAPRRMRRHDDRMCQAYRCGAMNPARANYCRRCGAMLIANASTRRQNFAPAVGRRWASSPVSL
jgi:ribosomal protein L40E